MTEVCVGGNYRVGRRIGRGSFGEIYAGIDVLTGAHVAIKVESLRKRNPHLLHESKLYRSIQGIRGVPIVYWYGVEGEFSILVMELLGPSVEDLFERSNQEFTLKTAVMIGWQMVTRLEGVHSQGIVHRDIKPHNFTIGRSDRESSEDRTKLIYIIDFGLSKRYCDSRHAHMPFRDGRNLTGTARYVSINTHLGVEPSRRDDLESCMYVLLYFLRGGLPWQGLRAATKKEKYDKIMEKKIESSIESLCEGLPKEIAECLAYCRTLRFSEKPDYGYVKSKLTAVLLRRNMTMDNIFDWNSPSFSGKLSPSLSGSTTSGVLPFRNMTRQQGGAIPTGAVGGTATATAGVSAMRSPDPDVEGAGTTEDHHRVSENRAGGLSRQQSRPPRAAQSSSVAPGSLAKNTVAYSGESGNLQAVDKSEVQPQPGRGVAEDAPTTRSLPAPTAEVPSPPRTPAATLNAPKPPPSPSMNLGGSPPVPLCDRTGQGLLGGAEHHPEAGPVRQGSAFAYPQKQTDRNLRHPQRYKQGEKESQRCERSQTKAPGLNSRETQRNAALNRIASSIGGGKAGKLNFLKTRAHPDKETGIRAQDKSLVVEPGRRTSGPTQFEGDAATVKLEVKSPPLEQSPKAGFAWSAASAMASYLGLRRRRSNLNAIGNQGHPENWVPTRDEQTRTGTGCQPTIDQGAGDRGSGGQGTGGRRASGHLDIPGSDSSEWEGHDSADCESPEHRLRDKDSTNLVRASNADLFKPPRPPASEFRRTSTGHLARDATNGSADLPCIDRAAVGLSKTSDKVSRVESDGFGKMSKSRKGSRCNLDGPTELHDHPFPPMASPA